MDSSTMKKRGSTFGLKVNHNNINSPNLAVPISVFRQVSSAPLNAFWLVTGSKDSRFGQLYADLIKTMDGTNWDIVSLRFARADQDAIAEGIAPDADSNSSLDFYFSSNNGPGTKTTFVPLEWMETMPLIGYSQPWNKKIQNRNTDDDIIIASRDRNHSTIYHRTEWFAGIART